MAWLAWVARVGRPPTSSAPPRPRRGQDTRGGGAGAGPCGVRRGHLWYKARPVELGPPAGVVASPLALLGSRSVRASDGQLGTGWGWLAGTRPSASTPQPQAANWNGSHRLGRYPTPRACKPCASSRGTGYDALGGADWYYTYKARDSMRSEPPAVASSEWFLLSRLGRRFAAEQKVR